MNTDDLTNDLNNDLHDDKNDEIKPSKKEIPAYDTDEMSEDVAGPEDADDDVVFDEEAELAPAEALKKLRAKLKKAVEEKQTYLNGWQRDKAEFVNIRKRDDESKSEYLKFASAKVIEDVLPVLDSFDMAMSNKAGWESVSKEWRTGIEGIYNQLQTVLSKHEVTAFGQIGDAFDPNLHHSIATVPAEDKSKDHTIAEILQKGYKIKDKVLRPALVKVFEA